MEFKQKADLKEEEMEQFAADALRQIEDKHYDTDMKDHGIREIAKYGIAFAGKNVEIAIGFPKQELKNIIRELNIKNEN